MNQFILEKIWLFDSFGSDAIPDSQHLIKMKWTRNDCNWYSRLL